MVRRTAHVIFLSALGAWSMVLLTAEALVSQDYARFYVSDIHSPVVVYAANTALCVALLWATALLFFIAARFAPEADAPPAVQIYLWSQVALFALVGLGDRFSILPRLAERLSVQSAWILVGAGVLEIGLLVLLGRVHQKGTRARLCAGVAILCFAIVVAARWLGPREWLPTSPIEQLGRTWASALVFLFGWDEMRTTLDLLRDTDAPEPRSTQE